MPFQPQNRNYLGNKFKLASKLAPLIEERLGKNGVLLDPFAGTGSIPYYLANKDRKIILVEQLVSSFLPLLCFFQPPRQVYAAAVIQYLNNIASLGCDITYTQNNFGGKYFSMENARRIDYIRDRLETYPNPSMRLILLTSLLYAADKVSWTFGHYDAFKKATETKNQALLKLDYPDLTKEMNKSNAVYFGDVMHYLLYQREALTSDVCFLDPPYNSRQYGANYHVLENLALWNHPPCHGITAKYASYPRSAWSTKAAPQVFEEFVRRCPSKHIIMTYNNQDGNTLTANQIVDAFEKRGKLEIHTFLHPIITTGKSNPQGNKEVVFVCETR